MRVLIHTFIVSLLFVLGIAFFWCPAQAIFSFTPVNWAVLYEKAHPAVTKTKFPWSPSERMREFLRRNTTGHQPFTAFISEKLKDKGIMTRDEAWIQWKTLHFSSAGPAQAEPKPVFMAADDPMAEPLVLNYGYVTILDKNMDTFVYTRLSPNDQYNMGIPSGMHYPFRMAATGFMAGALILGFLRPKSLGPVMASTPGTGARVFLFILALGFVGTALPWVYGFTKSTLYGIAVLGGFVFMLGAIGAFLFGREIVLTHRLLQGQGLVAHWTYTDKEWQAFTQWAVQEEKKQGLIGLGLISLMCLAIAGGFWAFHPDSGGAAACVVIIGLTGLIWIIAGVNIFFKHKKNKKGPGVVYIGEKLVYINGSVVSWGFLGSRLESMTLQTDPVPVITLVVSVIMMAGRTLFFFRHNYTYQIPVPKGRIKEAKQIIGKLTKNKGG